MARSVKRERLAALAIISVLSHAGCDWPWQHDMADQPSRPASAGARPPAAGSVPASESGPARSRGDLDTGRQRYSTYCAPCHGASGRGEGPVAREFAPPMGDLTSAEVQRRSDEWLFAVISNGTERMPRSAYELDRSERWAIVRYVRALGDGEP